MTAIGEKTETWHLAVESSAMSNDERHDHLLMPGHEVSGLVFTGIPWLHHEDGWKAGLKDTLTNYFPRYKLKRSGMYAYKYINTISVLDLSSFGLM